MRACLQDISSATVLSSLFLPVGKCNKCSDPFPIFPVPPQGFQGKVKKNCHSCHPQRLTCCGSLNTSSQPEVADYATLSYITVDCVGLSQHKCSFRTITGPAVAPAAQTSSRVPGLGS